MVALCVIIALRSMEVIMLVLARSERTGPGPRPGKVPKQKYEEI